MSETKKIKTIERRCPICLAKYQAIEKRPAPTCGNPACIREARAQGLPFVAPSATVTEKAQNFRKEPTGKSR